MATRSFPTVSIVIATFNSERTLELCLSKVAKQDYPKNKIEIIVADGGSHDSTLTIAEKYKAKVITVDPKKQNAEYNKGVGLNSATGELVIFLDHDNIMPHKKWITNMISPLVENKKIIASEPLRFHYDRSMTLLDRYFALFGGSDPVVYYLGKYSHLPYFSDKYNLRGKAQDMGNYYEVAFALDSLPALGGNGAVFRRRELLKYANSHPEDFIHTDVVADLVKKGFETYAIVKDSIMHLTNNKTLPFLKRRVYFIEKYQLESLKKRRYKIYDPEKDKFRLFLFALYSLTWVIPFLGALRGYIKIRDLAWFLHPFMCFSFLVMYSFPVIKGGFKNAILGK